ncbi:MAG TPA: hypothetical protein VEL73_00500 [Mycobacteriales bacterium]|nr:hypothetical protein [Mycobacteriales bacterium]
MTGQPVPPEWPRQVPRPGTPEWERGAVAWLLDLVPGEWRAYEVLRRHPVVLARLASGQVAASLEAARDGWRTLRRDLGRELPPEVVEAAMAAYEREGARLRELGPQVAAVREALHGRRWVLGTGRWAPPPGIHPPGRSAPWD